MRSTILPRRPSVDRKWAPLLRRGIVRRSAAIVAATKRSAWAYVATEYAASLVHRGAIQEILEIHRKGEASITTVLEQSARRGRHALTQAMVDAGVTVTRDAIFNAAKMGGIGVDLLLSGLQGDQLVIARVAALHARLLHADFTRAQALLDLGVQPSSECFNGLEVGAKKYSLVDWEVRCHGMLDGMLSNTQIEQLSEMAIDVILRAGRPIHIERMLDILRRPATYLIVPSVLARNEGAAIEQVRRLGVHMDDTTFSVVSQDMLKLRNYQRTLAVEPLLNWYTQDSGQSMTAATIAPLLTLFLDDREWDVRRLRGPVDYKQASQILLPFMNCTNVNEHMKLFDVIDRWAQRRRPAVDPACTATLKLVVQAANESALEQIDAGPAP